MSAETPGAPDPAPDAPAEGKECAECASLGGYLLGLAFAAFAAYVAADFYTGGALTAAAVRMLASVRAARGASDER